MKPTLRILAALFVVSPLCPLIPALYAGPDHDHNHGSTRNMEIVIPETREELRKAIQSEHAVLLQAVESKNDTAAHTAENNLQAYLKTLPEKLSDLEDADRKRIEGQVRNLARAYDAVHHATDDQAWDKAKSELKKAEGGLQLLATQLPR